MTPAEIAISILAELIAVRRGADTAGLSMKSVNLEILRDRHVSTACTRT